MYNLIRRYGHESKFVVCERSVPLLWGPRSVSWHFQGVRAHPRPGAGQRPHRAFRDEPKANRAGPTFCREHEVQRPWLNLTFTLASCDLAMALEEFQTPAPKPCSFTSASGIYPRLWVKCRIPSATEVRALPMALVGNEWGAGIVPPAHAGSISYSLEGAVASLVGGKSDCCDETHQEMSRKEGALCGGSYAEGVRGSATVLDAFPPSLLPGATENPCARDVLLARRGAGMNTGEDPWTLGHTLNPPYCPRQQSPFRGFRGFQSSTCP